MYLLFDTYPRYTSFLYDQMAKSNKEGGEGENANALAHLAVPSAIPPPGK